MVNNPVDFHFGQKFRFCKDNFLLYRMGANALTLDMGYANFPKIIGA